MKLFKICFQPFALCCFLAVMALLSNSKVLDVYNALFNLLSVEPKWVSGHSTTISNAGHVAGFFSLAILCRISTPLRYWQIALLCIALLCIALAASLELTQKLLTYRQGRWDDLLFGMTGTLMGLWVVSFWAKTERGTGRSLKSKAASRRVAETE